MSEFRIIHRFKYTHNNLTYDKYFCCLDKRPNAQKTKHKKVKSFFPFGLLYLRFLVHNVLCHKVFCANDIFFGGSLYPLNWSLLLLPLVNLAELNILIDRPNHLHPTYIVRVLVQIYFRDK